MSQMTKQFENVSIDRETYRNVRTMVTEKSVTTIKGLPTPRIIEIRYTMQKFRAQISNVVDKKANTVTIKNVMFQYVPAAEQAGKRWAFKKAIDETIALCHAIMTERGNVVSPLLGTAEQLQLPIPVAAEAVTDVDELEGMAVRTY
jgi:hypothetical protein